MNHFTKPTSWVPYQALSIIAAFTVMAGAAWVSAAPILTANSKASGDDLVDRTDGLVIPMAVHSASGADHEHAQRVIRVAQFLYTFWITGDSRYLDRAITPLFQGHGQDIDSPQSTSSKQPMTPGSHRTGTWRTTSPSCSRPG